VVRDIYSWFVNEGMSKRGIVKKLMASGIPSPAEYKKKNGLNYVNPQEKFGDLYWNTQTITAILKHEVYIDTWCRGVTERKNLQCTKILLMSIL
jgi:hypothetical protein